ncbi:hypothetical protein DENSPDRAFT_836354 [Dentipellis sp. KUC8613]|nr:hypothetical protein DENSPDRAFT_836354 [Dentipellis sp. KUC8613]
MPSSIPPPPLDLSITEHFSDFSDYSPFSSSRRPISQCSVPRTVSRSGSWADIASDGNPSDYVPQRRPSLFSISDVFPEGPFLADKQDHEQEQGCYALKDDAHVNGVSLHDTVFEANVSRSSATPKCRSPDSGPEYSSDETSSTTSRNSSYRSRRSGFYGSPASSVTPLSLPTQPSACASSIDLSSYSALARFVFDLRNDFALNAEDIEAVMKAMDDDVLDNPWLAFEDEMRAASEGEAPGASRPALVDFVPRKLSNVEELEEAIMEKRERVRRSLSVAFASKRGAGSPSTRSQESYSSHQRAASQPTTPRSPHPPVMIAPLISLDEARKKFAHADSLDIPVLPRTVVRDLPSPSSSSRSLRSVRERLRVRP